MAVVVRNCLGVDIGTHSIRIAAMERGKAGPRVVSLAEEALNLEPSLTEAQRNQRIARIIGDMLKREKIRTRNAVFCVPGQSVFIKRIKLPRTSPERMARIVQFEARQQIPFPLEKTIMEYQVFEEGEGNEVNVLLVAIKKEYIMNYMKMVRKTGLRPLAISVSSLALYNFHELNTAGRDLTGKAAAPEKKKDAKPKKEKKKLSLSLGKKKPAPEAEEPQAAEGLDEEAPLEAMGFEEIQAYVHLGAAMMDLAIPKPGVSRMIGFPRSVPLAGREMDRAIRGKLGLEDFEQARQIKETKTAVLSTEFEIDGDPESVDMEASQAVTGVADRMIAELRRSLDFYISQPDGVAVDSLVVSGGLARLNYLVSYIEEKLGIPVEQAEPKNQQMRMPDNMPASFAPFTVAVGLAAQGLGYAQNNIDFLPEDIKSVRLMQERRLEVAAMIVMLLVIVGMSTTVGDSRIAAWKLKTEEYQTQMRQAVKDDEIIQQAQAQHKQVAQAFEKLSKAAGYREFWLSFLAAFDSSRSPDILIDEIQMRADGNVLVRGKTQSQNSVNNFLEEIVKHKDLVRKAEINNIRQITDRRFPANVPLWDFTVTIKTLVRQGRLRTIGKQPLTQLEMQAEQMGGRGGAYGNPFGMNQGRGNRRIMGIGR